MRDATTGGSLDKRLRKQGDAGLREVSQPLREGSDQRASDALSTVDQALSESGQNDQYEGFYEALKDAVDDWKETL